VGRILHALRWSHQQMPAVTVSDPFRHLN
jgi:hypothetical protein